MRLLLSRLVVSVGLLSSAPANAMNWCGLPQVIPQREADFERLAPTVEGLTGCARQASDSAHRANWTCPDDPATKDTYEGVHIHYFREPGQGVHLVVIAAGLSNLDMLRRCGLRDIRDGERFSAGNVAYRDRIQFGILGPRLTLTSVVPKGMAAIISDTKSYGEDSNVEAIWQGIHGIKVESYPTTSVKLAGVSPISSDSATIVAAFERRGSQVRKTEDLDGAFPKWTLSAPVGLAGVSEVIVEGFVKHLLRADYVLNSTGDYERYIGLLDGEYGQSRRTSEGGCTYRWWESGRISIRGEHCLGKSDSLRFFNDVAGDQLEQVAAKLEADKAKPNSDPDKPAIDPDML